MVTMLGLLLTALLLVVGPMPATAASGPILVPAADAPWPGKIFVSQDEWALSDNGFKVAPTDATHFAQNLGRWFAGNKPGHFLVYSSSFGLTGQSLAKAMKATGNTWDIINVNSKTPPLTLQQLQKYNAVFLAGTATDTSVLIDYVRSGGNVYVAGGTGRNDGELWNRFLTAFGLRFEHHDNRMYGTVQINSTSPVFTGVDRLMVIYGTPIEVLDESSTDARILVTQDGDGVFAVYDTGSQPVSLMICPEQLPLKKNTPVSMTIAGAADFDVRNIDRDTIRVIGVKAKDFKTDYSASPVVGALLGRTVVGDCTVQVPDLYLDLSMRVDSFDLQNAIEQAVGRPLHDGETIAVTLSGRLRRENGGTPFVGEDLIVVVRPGK